MYNIELSPTARNDFKKITQYIRDDLYNPEASGKFEENAGKKIKNLYTFPRMYTIHESVKPLKHEYRRFMIGNYIVFYTIDEKNNKISVVRVLYYRRDSVNILV